MPYRKYRNMNSVRYFWIKNQYEDEKKKGVARFSEDFGAKSKDILYANLLVIYNNNLIEDQKRPSAQSNLCPDANKPYSPLTPIDQNQVLAKILDTLRGQEAKFENSEFIRLLRENKDARKYLVLFYKELAPELQKELIVYEIQKAYARLCGNKSKKSNILQRLTCGKNVSDEEFKELCNSRIGGNTQTGKMLKYFNLQKDSLQNYGLPSKEIEVKKRASSSQSKKVDYYNLSGVAALCAAAVRSVKASLFGKNTHKKLSNEYLKNFLKGVEQKPADSFEIITGFQAGKHKDIFSLYEEKIAQTEEHKKHMNEYTKICETNKNKAEFRALFALNK